jgi:hypothetical protein
MSFKAISVMLVVAAILAAGAQAAPPNNAQDGQLDPWAYGLVHRSNAARADENGPLDGWAYGLVHRSAAPPNSIDRNGSGLGGIEIAGIAIVSLLLLGVCLRTIQQRRIARA